MYGSMLVLHGAWRWVVLALGALAVALAVAGWLRGKAWTPGVARSGTLFMVSVDIQAVLGVLLFAWLSPLTQAAFADFGSAMRDRELRFFAVEHTLAMVLALLLVHVAAVAIRRARSDAGRYRRAAWLYGIALLLLVAGTPWMRPFLRA
jgi:hypothetical protein